jgi:uncharacterized repeat protein (TIGR03803 family)
MRHLRSNASAALLAALISLVSLNNAEARGEKVIYSFSGSDGAHASSALITGANGNLYGTTAFGGASNAGTVFRLTPHGKEKVLYSFTGGGDGSLPSGGLAMDAKGNLYGTTYVGGANGMGAVFKLTPRGTETVLHSFGGAGDAYNPEDPLTIDASGNLYSTTEFGGIADEGALFKVAPKGKETILYSFTGGSDGALPRGGVIMDASGNLYGTTSSGGDSNLGTVFKLTPSGEKPVLYSFGGGSDGTEPAAGLIMDDSGNLYGTTQF